MSEARAAQVCRLTRLTFPGVRCEMGTSRRRLADWTRQIPEAVQSANPIVFNGTRKGDRRIILTTQGQISIARMSLWKPSQVLR